MIFGLVIFCQHFDFRLNCGHIFFDKFRSATKYSGNPDIRWQLESLTNHASVDQSCAINVPYQECQSLPINTQSPCFGQILRFWSKDMSDVDTQI